MLAVSEKFCELYCDHWEACRFHDAYCEQDNCDSIGDTDKLFVNTVHYCDKFKSNSNYKEVIKMATFSDVNTSTHSIIPTPEDALTSKYNDNNTTDFTGEYVNTGTSATDNDRINGMFKGDGIATLNGVQPTHVTPTSCTTCVHCGVCKHEDKLAEIYEAIHESVKDKTAGHDFIEDVTIKCKHYKDKHNATLPNWTPGIRTPEPIPCTGPNWIDTTVKPNWYYDDSTTSTSGIHPDANVVTTAYNTNPAAIDTSVKHPRFNTDPKVSTTIMSKDDVVNAAKEYASQPKDIGSMKFDTGDKGGKERTVSTKIVTKKKPVQVNPVDTTTINDQMNQQAREDFSTATVPGVARTIDTRNIPVKEININDVPEQFRPSIQDNTVREAIPGQTSNV